MKEKEEVPRKILYQVHIDENLLREAQKKAKAEDLKLTQVIRRLLMEYVRTPQMKLF
jgi:antitoxin component of RelBE/YafQ-DinJ toxin-antitoxin module